MRLTTENLGKDRVKCAHPQHGGRPLPHTCSDTFLHLARRLVGKGKRKNGPRLIAMLKQICYLVCEHTCLARTRTRYHKRRPVKIAHRIELRSIQLLFVVYHLIMLSYFLRR